MPTILFTDDDQSLLASLRRWFALSRPEWKTFYAIDAEEAWGILMKEQIDIAISDMRMPGPDGAELLSVMRQNRPETARLVLSGYSDPSASVRSLLAAHQFLMKPVDLEHLEHLILGMLEARAHLPVHVWQAIDAVDSLPGDEQMVFETLRMLMDNAIEPTSFNTIVLNEPSLTAKFLQVSGSSFFGKAEDALDPSVVAIHVGANTLAQLGATAEFARPANPDDPFIASQVDAIRHHSCLISNTIGADPSGDREHRLLAAAAMLHAVSHLVIGEQGPLFGEFDRHQSPRCFHSGAVQASTYLATLWGIDPAVTHVLNCAQQSGATTCAEAITAGYNASKRLQHV